MNTRRASSRFAVALSLAACGGSRTVTPAAPANSSPVRSEPSHAVVIAPRAVVVPITIAPDSSAAPTTALPPNDGGAMVPMPAASALPAGISISGEPTDEGGAVVVVANLGRTRLRLRSYANVESYFEDATHYPSGTFLPVENATISLNRACAERPECLGVSPGQSVRAPVWPGTQCPSVQCQAAECRHAGAGIYRFVVTQCSGERLEGAPFRLGPRRAPSTYVQ